MIPLDKPITLTINSVDSAAGVLLALLDSNPYRERQMNNNPRLPLLKLGDKLDLKRLANIVHRDVVDPLNEALKARGFNGGFDGACNAVAEQQPLRVAGYDAVVSQAGVQIGCQFIPKDKVEKILELINKSPTPKTP